VGDEKVDLTERQQRILRAIVDQYITSAHPVGSASLASIGGLGVSPATIRNEMARLEELGYVRHLHTSGGRVPTHAGYRYYVQRLMEPGRLPSSDAVTIRHQFHQAHTELQEWLKLAANIVAHRMHNVGLVTAPRSLEVRLRHLEAISIQATIALLIIVLQDGTVLQEMVTLAEPHSQEELSSMADHLSARVRGMTAAQVEAIIGELPPLQATVGSMTFELMRRAEGRSTQIFHAGLGDMIRQPEFQEPRPGEPVGSLNERLRQMVEFLQQGVAIQRLLSELPLGAEVQVVIGSDLGAEGLKDYSFVLGRYGDQDDATGFLGVAGPNRMEYPRAVALVRYMTDLMTDLMQAY
jgi:heat-inducible transcriptional repressor